MKKQVLDTKGNKVEEITLSDSVFDIEPNVEVINQYVRVYRANQRQGTSSTKNRGEVAGSSQKPWRQKGTGRARVGTKRNPIWRTGGVAHGPRPKSWSLKLTKKLKKLALRSVLSLKFKEDQAYLIDKIAFKEPKTKEMVAVLSALNTKGKTLLVLDKINPVVLKSGSNIKNLSTIFIDNLNPYEILNTKNLILTKDSALILDERYKK